MTQPPANVVPVCYRHPDRETYVRCTRCDRPICPNCMNEASVGFQCPECVRAGARSQRPARTTFGGGTSGAQGTVTITLIVLNVLAFFATIISSGTGAVAGGGWGGLLGGSTPLHQHFAELGYASYVPGGEAHGIAAGEYYRLLTAMFLHYGVLHLLMNMWGLWVIGRPLEAALGRARFLALYLAAGLGGGVAVYLFSAPNALSAGASGALFGLFGALIVVLRRLRLSVAGVVPVLVLNLILTFSIPQIAIGAHIGGLVTGTLVAVGLAYAPQKHRTLVQSLTIGALVLIMILATVWRTVSLTG